MKEIKLSKGSIAIIDDDDYAELSKYNWCYMTRYACRNLPRNGRKVQQKELLHRRIMGHPIGMQVDHINGNTLDNRKCNLRLCTNAQNRCNRRKHKVGYSKYKGVCYYKKTGAWSASIKHKILTNNKLKHLGFF